MAGLSPPCRCKTRMVLCIMGSLPNCWNRLLRWLIGGKMNIYSGSDRPYWHAEPAPRSQETCDTCGIVMWQIRRIRGDLSWTPSSGPPVWWSRPLISVLIDRTCAGCLWQRKEMFTNRCVGTSLRYYLNKLKIDSLFGIYSLTAKERVLMEMHVGLR